MPFNEREVILSSLEIVDEVIDFDDDKNGSCCAALEKIKLAILMMRLSFVMEEIVMPIISQR